MSPLLLLLAACAEEPAPPTARAVPGGVEVRASVPLDRVSVLERGGVPLASRSLQTPLTEATVPARWEPGAELVAELRAGERVWRVPVEVPATLAPLALELAAPLGQQPVALEDGARVAWAGVEGARSRVGLTLSAREALTARLTRGDTVEERALAAGERVALDWEAPACAPAPCVAEQPLIVEAIPAASPEAPTRLSALLAAELLPRARAAELLSLEESVFPADQAGRADLVRPPERVSLPGPGWSALLRATGLGFRAREPELPWAWQGVLLRNKGVTPINVVVRSRVLGPDGRPDPAFRPRLRETDDGTGTVSALLRVPAGGEARAALPVFVDEPRLGEGPWTREIEITPLGSSEALIREARPLGVRRGDPRVSGALGLTLVAALGGLAWTGRGLGRWMVAARTSELTTISLFGALSFTVSAMSQLVSMGVSAVLGPFSAFAVGLVDDALRTALWATLVTLLPRPGVVTLALLVGWLLRVLALGSMGPVDLLFLGSHVAWLEGCLWVFGLTRAAGWREEGRGPRALRLGLGFGLASALATASGLALSAGLYRLFYADWYALSLIALPGFLYSALAAGLATRFADGLRRVEP